MDFHGGKVWCLCADISWITYKIYSCSDSCSMNLCFLRFNISYCSHIVFLSVLWFFLVEDEFYCVCSRLFSHPGIVGQVCCTLGWYIPVHSS